MVFNESGVPSANTRRFCEAFTIEGAPRPAATREHPEKSAPRPIRRTGSGGPLTSVHLISSPSPPISSALSFDFCSHSSVCLFESAVV
ncbi:hypothetical protein CDAR_92871 [Caerostris darwini]|uniref:Uncharacterized protein n=1 Tax=Caerostris darwini TaxID=1538125 RepID=A0AAV4PP19_9ARAC|nr:hypothetical protein CDAR_92871 [Caerostris darwini]